MLDNLQTLFIHISHVCVSERSRINMQRVSILSALLMQLVKIKCWWTLVGCVMKLAQPVVTAHSTIEQGRGFLILPLITRWWSDKDPAEFWKLSNQMCVKVRVWVVTQSPDAKSCVFQIVILRTVVVDRRDVPCPFSWYHFSQMSGESTSGTGLHRGKKKKGLPSVLDLDMSTLSLAERRLLLGSERAFQMSWKQNCWQGNKMMRVRDTSKTKRRWDTLPTVSRGTRPFGACQHVCLIILSSYILSHRGPTSSSDIEFCSTCHSYVLYYSGHACV